MDFRSRERVKTRCTSQLNRELANHPIGVPVAADDDSRSEVTGTPDDDALILAGLMYDAGAVSEMREVDPSVLAHGFDVQRLDLALDVLRVDGKTAHGTYTSALHLTPVGRASVVAARTAEETSVRSHSVTNDFSGATITGSNVATGGTVTQHGSIEQAIDVEALRTLLDLANELDTAQLTTDEMDDFTADLEVLKAQLDDPSTVRNGLRRAVGTVRAVAISTAGSAAAIGLLEAADSVLRSL